MLGDPLGWLFFLLFSGGQKPSPLPGPAPGPAPAPAPVFPVAPPSTLPPFPSGWCIDFPMPPEVLARSLELAPTLWAKGAGATQQEMTGGRWITYKAETIDGLQAITAWRTDNCPPVNPAVVPPPSPDVPPGPAPAPSPDVPPAPVPPPAPAPVVPPSPGPVVPPAPWSGPPPMTALQAAAHAMNAALKTDLARGGGGYRKSDQQLYKTFQSATGGVLGPDGWPGTSTMTMLRSTLAGMGEAMAPVVIYPWKSAGGWKHPNAPTSAEWNR